METGGQDLRGVARLRKSDTIRMEDEPLTLMVSASCR